MNGFYRFAISVLRVVMPLWYKLDTEGLENIPEGSGYLFVSNHRSNLDTIVLQMTSGVPTGFVAKTELKKVPLLGDIPLLGMLFTHTETTHEPTNLLIFVTATIINENGEYVIVTP